VSKKSRKKMQLCCQYLKNPSSHHPLVLYISIKRTFFRRGAWFVMKNQLFSLRDTSMSVRSQRPLHMQGDAGHPGKQGGGPQKNNRKKWRAKEEERHKGSPTPTPHPKKRWFLVYGTPCIERDHKEEKYGPVICTVHLSRSVGVSKRDEANDPIH
jgi:hypothetical protein